MDGGLELYLGSVIGCTLRLILDLPLLLVHERHQRIELDILRRAGQWWKDIDWTERMRIPALR
jgi:hypothetical protein